MKISVANTKIQLIQTLERIINDWLKDGVIQSLITYCNNSTEFPYSQLRKMEKMGIIRSLSSSKRNKTYEWLGEDHPNLEHIAQSIINFTGKQQQHQQPQISQPSLSTYKTGRTELIKLGVGMSALQNFETNGKDPVAIETESQHQDLTKLTIKIALILQKNGVSEDKMEPITASILSLLE